MNHEQLIAELEKTGQYKVLRKIVLRSSYGSGIPTMRGLIIDSEATGLDALSAEPIQVAALPFDYTADGQIVSVGKTFTCLNQPSIPIPEEVTQITGITSEMVQGHRLDVRTLDALVAQSRLVVAHNANYDRMLLERYLPSAKNVAWACSQKMIPWNAMGFGSFKLEFIASNSGHFYDAHRADADVEALLHLTAMPLFEDGSTPFSHLVASTRIPLVRVYAVQSIFESKDLLKARKYRWPGESGPMPKTWYLDLPATDVPAELEWLKPHLRGAPKTREISLIDRFSVRE